MAKKKVKLLFKIEEGCKGDKEIRGALKKFADSLQIPKSKVKEIQAGATKAGIEDPENYDGIEIHGYRESTERMRMATGHINIPFAARWSKATC